MSDLLAELWKAWKAMGQARGPDQERALLAAALKAAEAGIIRGTDNSGRPVSQEMLIAALSGRAGRATTFGFHTAKAAPATDRPPTVIDAASVIIHADRIELPAITINAPAAGAVRVERDASGRVTRVVREEAAPGNSNQAAIGFGREDT